MLVQPDGAIVIAGTASIVGAFGISDGDFAAVRYTSSGALDAGFGNGGIATINIAGRTDIAYAAVLQIDGKLVMTGRVANTGGDDPDIGLVRFDTNGIPDATFGTGGIVRVTTPDWDEASDIVVQPDGSIVVSGFTIVGSSAMLTVARFDSAGASDAGFGTGGFLRDPVMERGRSLALQGDGQIVVAGSVGEYPGDMAVARLNAIGALDTGFGESGLLRFDFFGGSDGANAVVIQADGKIVAGGYAVNGTQMSLALIRVLP
ncbi:MAG TPA: delta-60 repeat domain-containing protein [Woeseiaceae bacterium]|nr:delta-60 repeat domain-containing protein [Woeseiaceae bacterium]